jgi:hypothetical protein
MPLSGKGKGSVQAHESSREEPSMIINESVI